MKSIFKINLAILIVLSFWSCNTKTNSSKTAVNDIKSVEMVTNYGTMVIELSNETPLHRDNFIKLVNEKAYDSLLFHRVIENFMIQGGDPESRVATSEEVLGNGDLEYTVEAEFHSSLFHKKGVLATAREESLNRASSAIQFYLVQGKVFNDSLLDHAESRINTMLARHHLLNDTINKPLWEAYLRSIDDKDRDLYTALDDSINGIAKSYTNFEKYTIPQTHREVYKTIGGTPHLDQNYTVFGEVVKGLEVIDSIAGTKTDEGNRPISDVRILSVQIQN